MNVSELFGLKDQVAVVTGASGVLGGEIARGLAGAGARVGLLARRREPLEELARSLGDSAVVLEAAQKATTAQLDTTRSRRSRKWLRDGCAICAMVAPLPMETSAAQPSKTQFAVRQPDQRRQQRRHATGEWRTNPAPAKARAQLEPIPKNSSTTAIGSCSLAPDRPYAIQHRPTAALVYSVLRRFAASALDKRYAVAADADAVRSLTRLKTGTAE